MGEIRVGIVNYLNSRPLAWGFLTGRIPAGIRPSFHPPAEVANLLERGELDAGLIPSIELQRIEGIRALPGLCIAATHEVESVLLVSRSPLQKIERVALDENSRTSAVLVRLILGELHGLRPEYVSAAPSLDRMLAEADAALLIGDPALHVDRQSYLTLDLAAEWRRLTGHPFVFALWALREGAASTEISQVFAASLEAGLGEMDRIVSEAVDELRLPRQEVHQYLTQSLSYRLGQEELAGLEAFYSMAVAKGYLESLRPDSMLG